MVASARMVLAAVMLFCSTELAGCAKSYRDHKIGGQHAFGNLDPKTVFKRRLQKRFTLHGEINMDLDNPSLPDLASFASSFSQGKDAPLSVTSKESTLVTSIAPTKTKTTMTTTAPTDPKADLKEAELELEFLKKHIGRVHLPPGVAAAIVLVCLVILCGMGAIAIIIHVKRRNWKKELNEHLVEESETSNSDSGSLPGQADPPSSSTNTNSASNNQVSTVQSTHRHITGTDRHLSVEESNNSSYSTSPADIIQSADDFNNVGTVSELGMESLKYAMPCE